MRGRGFIPPGTSFSFSGVVAPDGYLLEYGQAVSRTTYADLLGAITLAVTGNTTSGNAVVASVSAPAGVDITADIAIGMKIEGAGVPAGATIAGLAAGQITLSANATATASGVTLRVFPHGSGDGSTTFNVPDMRGRVTAGRDNMGGTAASRLTNSGTGNPGVNGAKLGDAAGVDRHAVTAAQMPAHDHNLLGQLKAFTDPGAGSGQYIVHSGGGSGNSNTWLDNTGSSEAHPNVQPTLIKNWIIKT